MSRPLPRREFLRLGSSALALAALPGFVHAAASRPRSSISLGHSLYGMPKTPLPEAVALCARIGFRNVELMLDPGFTAEPKQLSKTARRELRAQLASLGLTVSALMRNLRLTGGLSPQENLDALKEAAELAHDISPESPPPVETILGGKPEDWEPHKEQLAATLREWQATAHSARLELLVKAHVMMAVDTPQKLLWLLDQVPGKNVNVAFDYSHFEPQGISLEESWAALRARTKFVHVKDTKKENGKVLMLLPGDGVVDYPKFFRLLAQDGYRGAVVGEVSSQIFRLPGYDAVATAEKCYRVLSEAMRTAGVVGA